MFLGFLLDSLQGRFFSGDILVNILAPYSSRGAANNCARKEEDFQQHRNMTDLMSPELSEMENNFKITSSPFVYVFICVMHMWIFVCVYIQTYIIYMYIDSYFSQLFLICDHYRGWGLHIYEDWLTVGEKNPTIHNTHLDKLVSSFPQTVVDGINYSLEIFLETTVFHNSRNFKFYILFGFLLL